MASALATELPPVARRRALSRAQLTPLSLATKRVKTLTALPFAAVGRLFIRQAGVDTAGTAWVVGRSAVITAGHCLLQKGHFSENILFVPQYRDGQTIGAWPCGPGFVPNDWSEHGKQSADMGAVITTRRLPKKIRLPYLVDIPHNQGAYFQLGYPKDPHPRHKFNGERMWQSHGDYMQVVNGLIWAAGSFTGGASGGPWCILRNGVWYANGLGAAAYTPQADINCSPYFGDNFRFLINQLARMGAM